MLNAIATCHHGGSSVCSSTEDMAMPCLFKTSEQLDAGECSWGLQLTKQRSAPAGQKRTRNGTSIPRNFNFCSNAPVQLQNQGLMWELLQAQDSRRGAALLGEEGRGTDAPSCQLFSIRSCTQGLTAYALACHDSNSCEACLLAGQGAQCEILGSVGTCGSTTSPGEEPPAASHSPLDHLLWCSSRIKCRKQRNRWQGHHFFLFKFVFVSIDRAKAAVCSAAHTKAKKGP